VVVMTNAVLSVANQLTFRRKKSPPSSESNKLSKKLVVSKDLLQSAAILVSSLAYSSTLKMEAICFPETSADSQRTTWRYTLEGRTLDGFCLN
jgi:hypothetical protein